MNERERIIRRAMRKAAMKKKMNLVGFIPARGKSKAIAKKNLAMLAGYPLLAHSILALKVAGINDVYVSTDCDEIANTAKAYGAKVVKRPPEIAMDDSPTELAIRHFLSVVECDAVAMVQCTSPFLQPLEIERAVEKFKALNYDSLFTVVSSKALDILIWDMKLQPMNYDPKKRAMRQTRAGYFWIETGGLYLFKSKKFLQYDCRICGRFDVYEIPSSQMMEIDDKKDLGLARKIMEKHR